MKLAYTLVAACVAFASHVAARGVCYDPAHVDPITVDTIRADYDKIKASGFDTVRTYFTKFADTDLGSLAIERGLNVSLGIPLRGDAADTEVHVQAAIAAAQKHNGNAGVVTIFVGNENLANVNAVPPEMVPLIQRIKAAAPGVRVGTVQRNTELLDPSRTNAVAGLRELLSACDVVGVNMHPFFNPRTEAWNAVNIVNDQWRALHSDGTRQQFPGLPEKLVITEVGWPSAGSAAGNYGSIEGAAQVYQGIKAWVQGNNLPNDGSYYFQYFDLPRRTDGEFEKHFGLVDQFGNPKFGF